MYSDIIFLYFQIHQNSCKGLALKVANNQSSPIQQQTASPSSSSNNNNLQIQANTIQSSNPGKQNKSSLDLLYMDSPAVMRRTLHNQDDTVVASHSSYEDSLLKQVQINQKDNNNASD